MLEDLRDGLAVSCQIPEDSPLRQTHHIVEHVQAAVIVEANTVSIKGISNVAAILVTSTAPAVGITKPATPGSDLYIARFLKDVRQLCEAGADMVAFDATKRPRSSIVSDLIAKIHPAGRVASVDISTFRGDARAARAYGTSRQRRCPDVCLAPSRITHPISYSCSYSSPSRSLSPEWAALWEPSEVRLATESGAMLVVGSAITRPDVITRRFADAVAGLAT